MRKDKKQSLRQYYHSLRQQQKFFDGTSGSIAHHSVRVLDAELQRLQAEHTDVVPPFNMHEHLLHSAGSGNDYYNSEGIRVYLGMVVGRLEILIEEEESIPVTETREFTFVAEQAIREILERDYAEIQRAYVSKCWKSVIVLSGGAIEAVLVDLVLGDDKRAISASAAPKSTDPKSWGLASLIDVCLELRLIKPGIEKLSHSVREYRNLVHPGRELRGGLSANAEEARIALEVLNMLHRDLSV